MNQLNTKSLALSPATEADIDALHTLWMDADIRKHLWDDEIISRETAEAVVTAGIESFAKHRFGQWAVRENGNDTIIGFCGLRYIDDTDVVEILYGIHPEKWGRGYATEAASAVLDHGFRVGGLSEIVAEMDLPNAASAQVAKKLGMRFIKEYERQGLPTLRYALSGSGAL